MGQIDGDIAAKVSDQFLGVKADAEEVLLNGLGRGSRRGFCGSDG